MAEQETGLSEATVSAAFEAVTSGRGHEPLGQDPQPREPEPPAEPKPLPEEAGSEQPDRPDEKEWLPPEVYWKKRFGDSQNELGQLRQRLQQLEQAQQQPQPQQQEYSAADPENVRQAALQRWRQMDPASYEKYKDDEYFQDQALLGYKQQQMAMLTAYQMMQQVRSELSQLSEADQLKAALGDNAPALVKEIMEDDVLRPLWQQASPDQRVALAQRLAASQAQKASGGAPGEGAASPQPRLVRRGHVESAGGRAGAPQSNTTSEQANLQQMMELAKNGKSQDSPEFKAWLDGMLDAQMSGLRGAQVNPSARGRG